MDRQLDRFRKTPEKDGYLAFRIADKELRRLIIRPVWHPWERIAYGYLQRILQNGVGTQIGLVYAFAVVIIKGKNLEPVIDAIDQQRCEFVQEFDKDVWTQPSDPTAPFISAIDTFTETRERMVQATDQFSLDTAKLRSSREH